MVGPQGLDPQGQQGLDPQGQVLHRRRLVQEPGIEAATLKLMPPQLPLALATRSLYILDVFEVRSRPILKEDHHNFAGTEIQAKQSYSNLYIVKIDNPAI